MKTKVNLLQKRAENLAEEFKLLKAEKDRLEKRLKEIGDVLKDEMKKLDTEEVNGIILVHSERWEWSENAIEEIEKYYPELIKKDVSPKVKNIWDVIKGQIKARPKKKVISYLKIKGGE